MPERITGELESTGSGTVLKGRQGLSKLIVKGYRGEDGDGSRNIDHKAITTNIVKTYNEKDHDRW